MREETLSAVVGLPVDAVWDYLADYDHVVRLGWDEVHTRPMRPSLRCRARYRVSVMWQGIRNDYVACLEQAERPRTLTWSTRDAGAKNWVRFDLTPVQGAQTRVDVTLHFKAAMTFGSLETTAWELLRPALVRTAWALEHLCETAVPATPCAEEDTAPPSAG